MRRDILQFLLPALALCAACVPVPARAGILDDLGLNKCNFAGQQFGVDTECKSSCDQNQINLTALLGLVPPGVRAEIGEPCSDPVNVCCADRGDALCANVARAAGAQASCKDQCGEGETDVRNAASQYGLTVNPCLENGICCVVGEISMVQDIQLPTTGPGAAPAAPEGTEVTPSAKGKTTVSYGLKNPLGSRTVPEIIGAIIKWFGGLAGSLFFLYLIWGGIEWMVAGGKDENVKKAQQKILYAIIGIVVVMLSYFIVEAIIGITNLPPGT